MSPKAASGKFADLGARIVTSLVLGGIAVAAIWAGGFWTVGLITLGAALMLAELGSITLARDGKANPGQAMHWALPAAVLPLSYLLLSIPSAIGGMVLAVLSMAAVDLLAGRQRGLAIRVMGSLWILLASLGFLWLRFFPEWGLLTAIWIALVVAASDVGGYFAGRLIGGAKLWPSVSPGKTWAGLAGAVALAFVAGWIFSGATTGTYFIQVCTVSAAAALLAQMGDLAESAIKRSFSVKDASALLPGHGGVLDRCDGLMAATLVATAVTYWRGQTVFIW